MSADNATISPKCPPDGSIHASGLVVVSFDCWASPASGTTKKRPFAFVTQVKDDEGELVGWSVKFFPVANGDHWLLETPVYVEPLRTYIATGEARLYDPASADWKVFETKTLHFKGPVPTPP